MPWLPSYPSRFSRSPACCGAWPTDILRMMKLVDVLAVALVVGAVGAFVAGEAAMTRAEDLRAVYWLAVGVVSLRAAVQVVRPGARP